MSLRTKLIVPLHALLTAALFMSPLYAADIWDVGEDFWSAAVFDENWTVDEDFPGTKLMFGGRYVLRRSQGQPRTPKCPCEPLPAPELLVGTLAGQLQFGAGESDIEYGFVSLTPWAWRRDVAHGDGVRVPPRETLELGVIMVSKDEPLGVEFYSELTAARIARTWTFQRPASPWRYSLGANLSGGYAWAESTDENYRDVSNLTAGTWARGTIGRDKWGTIYVEQRVVNGWTFSSPDHGGVVSRSAAFRFGYTNRPFEGCFGIELFSEKRSFNFADPDGPNLYTKARRFGVELSCSF
jgi:hypothetical protein